MDNTCLLLLLVLLFLISIILMAWILPRYMGEPKIIQEDNGDNIRQELGQLVFNNYRVDDFSQVYQVDVQPEEITLVMGSIDHNRTRLWTPFSKQRFEEYAEYHGYNKYYFTQPLDPEAPSIWQKVYAVYQALQQDNCQVVVWIDDDIIITTPQRPIEDFLGMTDKPMIFSMDIDPKPNEEPLRPFENYCNVINSGLFIIRKTPETLSFLEDVITGRTTLYDGYFNHHPYHEQSVMTYYLYSKYPDNFALMPSGYLQTIYKTSQWRPEHFSLHLAGENALSRYHVMKRVLDNTKIQY